MGAARTCAMRWWMNLFAVLLAIGLTRPVDGQARPDWTVVPRTNLWNAPTAVTGGVENGLGHGGLRRAGPAGHRRFGRGL